MKRLALLAFILAVSLSAFAQDPQTGAPQFGSIHYLGPDFVNRQNLNVNNAFPIVSLPGRGNTFSFAVLNDSLVWKRTLIGSTYYWKIVTDPSGASSFGWVKENPAGQLFYTSNTLACYDYETGGYEYFPRYFNYAYYDAQGTRHPFSVTYNLNCFQVGYGPYVGFATDNSGYKIDITTPNAPKVWDKAGLEMRHTNGYIVDANGNKTSFSTANSITTWTDTANHTALTIDKSNANYIDYKYKDNDGSTQAIRLNFDTAARNIKTNFGCTGPTIQEFTGTAKLPTSLVIHPDQPSPQTYSFEYESTPGWSGHYTGRLKQITLPTGGYVTYTYTGTNNGINCSDGTVKGLERRIYDSQNNLIALWTYTRAMSGADWVTTVIAPQLPYDSVANASTYTFNSSGQLIWEKFYQGTAITQNLKRQTSRTWAANSTPENTYVWLTDVSPNKISAVSTTFDSNGNLTSSTETAWGDNAAGPAIRTTQITYLTGTEYSNRNILNRPTQILVREGGATGTIRSKTVIQFDESAYINTPCESGGAQHDDANFGCGYIYRGLPTTVKTYTDAAGGTGEIQRHSFFDNYGNLRKADTNCCQQKEWQYVLATQFAFPTTVTSGPPGTQLSTSATYNANTGLIASATDENGQITSFVYDTLKRITSIVRPDTQTVNYVYNDGARTIEVNAPVQASDRVVTKTSFDTVGRAFERRLMDGNQSDTYSIVTSQFDPLGRAYRISQPHTGTASRWSETRFDALGRPILSQLLNATFSVVSGHTTTYSYAGNAATVQDPTGKQRKSQSDGVGRLEKVFEPDVDAGNSLTQETTYAYNALDSLTTVTQPTQSQGTQTRTYVYDDLGRLTSQTTPEAGLWSYQYNAFNLVTQRTDARGVITTYGYDDLNRLLTVAYNVSGASNPTVPATDGTTYEYGTDPAQNTKGRLKKITKGSGASEIRDEFTYDILGRITQLQRTIGGTAYSIPYEYNLAGEIKKITYPSTRAIQHNFDEIGRLIKIFETSATYAEGFNYNAAGQVLGFTYNPGANSVAAAFGFSSDRLQLESLSYTKNGAGQPFFSLAYCYWQTCDTQSGGNNGQITRITDNVDSNRTLIYAYDHLHRLKTAIAGPTQTPVWGLEFKYDRWGNRKEQRITAGSPPQHLPQIDAATNRVHGPTSNYCYDLNGNLLAESAPPCPSPTYVYDAENRMVNFNNGAAVYAYDGAGLRVKKVVSSTTTIYIYAGTKVVAEYENGSLAREYVYGGSQLIATISGGTTKFHHFDHLSVRATTDTSGSVTATQGHYPFGESWYETGGPGKLRFTTYERDNASGESGDDYAMMRSYVNRFGRFSSPDPRHGSITNPQSVNRYSYVTNDPVNAIDPLGLLPISQCFVIGCGFGLWPPADTTIEVHDTFEPMNPFHAGESYGQLIAPRDTPANELLNGQLLVAELQGIKKELLKAILKNAECSDLFGGGSDALGILGGFTGLVDVSPEAWRPTRDTSIEEIGAAGRINGPPFAAAVTPMSGRITGGRYNGTDFPIYIGSVFNALRPEQQLTIILHEMLHLAWPTRGNEVTETDGFNAEIAEKCRTGKVTNEGINKLRKK